MDVVIKSQGEKIGYTHHTELTNFEDPRESLEQETKAALNTSKTTSIISKVYRSYRSLLSRPQIAVLIY